MVVEITVTVVMLFIVLSLVYAICRLDEEKDRGDIYEEELTKAWIEANDLEKQVRELKAQISEIQEAAHYTQSIGKKE